MALHRSCASCGCSDHQQPTFESQIRVGFSRPNVLVHTGAKRAALVGALFVAPPPQWCTFWCTRPPAAFANTRIHCTNIHINAHTVRSYKFNNQSCRALPCGNDSNISSQYQNTTLHSCIGSITKVYYFRAYFKALTVHTTQSNIWRLYALQALAKADNRFSVTALHKYRYSRAYYMYLYTLHGHKLRVHRISSYYMYDYGTVCMVATAYTGYGCPVICPCNYSAVITL